MPTLPSDDIGEVLERFHKWAGSHAEPVRELTYEEAVKRSRRRVYDEEQTAQPEPAKAAAQGSGPHPAAASQTAAARGRAAEPASTSKGKSQKKAAAAKTGRSGNKSTERVSRKAAARPSPKNSAAAARETTMKTPSPAAAYRAAHQSEAEIVPPSAPAPSFEQVLAAQMHPAPASHVISADIRPVAPLPSHAPAVHLTVRLAEEERDAIRERAHDLGITPSAYLRHCILEMDALRAELEAARLAYAHASAAGLSTDAVALEGNGSLSMRRAAPRRYPTEGSWLRRAIRMILPGKAGKHTVSTRV
jgi:hypothetical protein